jgi:pimeloyl-ACP methyl ester carboxylesterase
MPAAVMIHAFPLAASMWEPQLKSPPAGWRLVAPDLRGFGGSTSADPEIGQVSIGDYAVDVIDLLAELGIGSVVVCGLSMGGYATIALLRRAPALASAVVFADTRAGADSLEARANRRSLLAVLEREGSSGVARDVIPKLLGPTAHLDRPDLEAGLRRLIKQQSPAAIRGAIVRLMDRPDSTPMLPEIRVPALVVVGSDDVVTPPVEAERLASEIPRAELIVIPRSGHLSNLEQPDAFSAALARFLSSRACTVKKCTKRSEMIMPQGEPSRCAPRSRGPVR